MRKLPGLVLASGMLLTAIYAAGKNPAVGEHKALKGFYSIYAGELGEEMAPTGGDRKLAIEIDGAAAKEIFDSMYPDFQPTCSGEKADRDRRKGDLYCSYSPETGYRCFLGYDLRKGRSIAGASC